MANAGGVLGNDPMMKRSVESAKMLPYWDLIDAVMGGIDTMKTLLPKFPDEDNTDYALRQQLCKFTNVTSDVIESLAAKPFEREVELVETETLKVPAEMRALEENVDGAGNNLTVFASQVFGKGIANGLAWIFVDFDKSNPNIKTLADYKAAGLRPYWSHVLARNILDAESTVIGGSEFLTYIKIFEPGRKNHIREFTRSSDGVVVWKLYEQRETIHVETKSLFHEIDRGVLSIKQIPLVPFVAGKRDGRTWFVKPSMQAAVELQRTLFYQESGVEYAKHLTAYPMLAGNGVAPELDEQKKPKKLRTGPNRVLYAPPNAAGHSGNWSYIEPNAESLKFLASDVSETIRQLRELGRQPLTAQSGNLTTVTTTVAAGKSKSAVKQWALILKDMLENAFVITTEFLATVEYDPEVNVYDEFDEFLDGKDLDTLTEARKNRDLSQKTYWSELVRRNVLRPDFSSESEEQRLLDETPDDNMPDGTDVTPDA